MRTAEFDYPLPKHLIAQVPSKQRDHARLMVLGRNHQRIEHRKFFQITEYLTPTDVLILNNTKVIPVKLIGKRISGGLVEILMVKEISPDYWSVLVQGRGRLKNGEIINLSDENLRAELRLIGTEWFIKFSAVPTGPATGGSAAADRQADIKPYLERIGKMPLPPYIKRVKKDDPYEVLDRERYQTVYANKAGSIAAPTAGLHFTPDLLDNIRTKGTKIAYLTLMIGRGTFKPVQTPEVSEHRMETEYFEVPLETVRVLIDACRNRRRIIAVGTTVCRVLETIADDVIKVHEPKSYTGWSRLFICPPYQFKLVGGLITNFHLPKGTPLILTSAFAGREKVMEAYQEAIKEGYRFYSYGDAMAIL